jgi:hypothetical protein
MIGAIATISGFLGVVMLVAGVLPVILFFKVWRMTNDVQEIKRRLLAASPSSECDLVKEIYKKNPQIASLLFDAVYAEMRRAYIDGAADYDRIVTRYRPLYVMAGLSVPEVFEAIHDSGEWHDRFESFE